MRTAAASASANWRMRKLKGARAGRRVSDESDDDPHSPLFWPMKLSPDAKRRSLMEVVNRRAPAAAGEGLLTWARRRWC
jgi:hypothetical protein